MESTSPPSSWPWPHFRAPVIKGEKIVQCPAIKRKGLCMYGLSSFSQARNGSRCAATGACFAPGDPVSVGAEEPHLIRAPPRRSSPTCRLPCPDSAPSPPAAACPPPHRRPPPAPPRTRTTSPPLRRSSMGSDGANGGCAYGSAVSLGLMARDSIDDDLREK